MRDALTRDELEEIGTALSRRAESLRSSANDFPAGTTRSHLVSKSYGIDHAVTYLFSVLNRD